MDKDTQQLSFIEIVIICLVICLGYIVIAFILDFLYYIHFHSTSIPITPIDISAPAPASAPEVADVPVSIIENSVPNANEVGMSKGESLFVVYFCVILVVVVLDGILDLD